MSDLGTITHMLPAFGDAGAARWEIKARPDVMMRVKKALPKTETRRKGGVLLSDTPENARELTWLLDRWDLKLTDDARAHLEARTKQFEDHEATVRQILTTSKRPPDALAEPAAKVDDYQYQAADLAIATGGTVLGDDLAMGKTRTGLLIFRQLLPGIVVAEPHLLLQWQEELFELLPWVHSHIIRSSTVYDPSTRREAKGHYPDVLFCTYTMLHGWSEHLAGEIKGMVCDETQELRRRGTRKHKAAGQVADGAVAVMGISNTPTYNMGGEIYNVLDVVRPGELGEPEEFAREWGTGSSEGTAFAEGRLKVKSRELGIYLRERGLVIARTWEQVGRKRPAKPMRITHTIPADSEIVDEARDRTKALAELILNGGGTRQEIFEAETKVDHELRKATGVAKAPYVAEFVRMLLESQEKVVVWAWHRAVYAILNELLEEFGPVMYTGSETRVGKRVSEKAFVEGDARVLLMSLRSGSGLDGLQKACNVGVFAELDWSPQIHKQCLGRLPRPGQRKPTVGYFLVSEIGSDPALVELNDLKRSQGEPLVHPDADLLEPVAKGEAEHIRMLAEAVLGKEPLAEVAA